MPIKRKKLPKNVNDPLGIREIVLGGDEPTLKSEAKFLRKEKIMGCYDTILIPCPECGLKQDTQSKGGECSLRTFYLEDCPADVLSDINRHAPFVCEKCETGFEIEFIAKVIKL